MADCLHLPDFVGEICNGCGDEIDQYGNTENDFNACSFPHCGCDGARLCMAGEASDRAADYNVEGMHHSTDPKARMRFQGAFYSGEFEPAQGIEAAAADETAQQAQPEGQEPGPAGMRPNTVSSHESNPHE